MAIILDSEEISYALMGQFHFVLHHFNGNAGLKA